MMSPKRIKILLFLVVSLFEVGLGQAQRSQIDGGIRGHSFGLENYLFQTYEAPEVNTIRNIKFKRVRPTGVYKTTSADREQNFEAETLHPPIYESSRLKPTPPRPNFDSQKTSKLVSEPKKPQVHFALQEATTAFNETPQPEIITQEAGTERIRKRIMMRRRRKRPQNTNQQDSNSEAILKPMEVPVSLQAPKVVIRSKLPETPQRIRQPAVKLTTDQPQLVVEEEFTTETEKMTMTTTPEPTTTEKPSTINLKTFLKQQTETLSLSELLQTQNLSLADLLRGNKDASAILKGNLITSSTTAAPKRKVFNNANTEKNVTQETTKFKPVDSTTTRPIYNKFYPKIPRIKPSEQPLKPEEEKIEEEPKLAKKPNLPNTEIRPINRINEMRLKLRNFQKKTSPEDLTTTRTTTPEKVEVLQESTASNNGSFVEKNKVFFKSTNNPELSVILPSKLKPEPDTQKRPERLSNWTNRLPSIKRFGQERIKISESSTPNPHPVLIPQETKEKKEENIQMEPEEPKTANPFLSSPEVKKPEPKDELIELLKSDQHANKLQKILSSRNMTLQELLENREKPPLQTNISELFTSELRQTPTMPPTVVDDLPDFPMEGFNRFGSYDEPFAEESAPTIARVELVANREPKNFDVTFTEKEGSVQLNLQPDDLKPDTSSAENSALWNLAEKSIYYGNSYGYGESFIVQYPTEKSVVDVKTTEFTESDVILLETLRKSQDTNRKFKLDFEDFVKDEAPELEDIEKSYIPPAVKSAIIASGVVMGLALFVFIAIFATCGWKQRQIRLKGATSILGNSSTKSSNKSKCTNTLSPVSFKDSNSYKKTLDFDDESSESGTSNTSSYLWSTLKNTFTSRTSTLKSRLEKEEKLREDKVTLRRNDSRRKTEDTEDNFHTEDERVVVKKIDRDRNVINTSFNFRRPSNCNNHFNECVHGY